MNEKEVWKDIPGYEGYYQVSNIGRVKSVDRNNTDALGRTRCLKGKVLSQKIRNGYKCVGLHKDGTDKCYDVHRLVAMAFIPNTDNLPIVNHRNEKQHDNRVENLEWCTFQYNITYGTARERKCKTQKRRGSNRCSKNVVCNGVDYESISDCAKHFGTTWTSMNNWLNGRYPMPQKFQDMGLRFA